MNIRVEGTNAVIQSVGLLPDALNNKIRKQIIGQAGERVADAARRFSPVRQGYFRRSIGVVVRHYKDTDTILAVVGSRRGKQWKDRANIAHLLEDGWRVAVGGTLKRKSGKTAAASKTTGKRGHGTVRDVHPGFHVMRRAVIAAGPQAVAYIHNALPVALAQAVQEVRRAG